MALLILGPVAAVAQSFPDYLPPQYRPFFKQFVDQRSLPERMLNVTGLSSGEYGRGFALIAGVSKYPRMAGPNGNLVAAAEDIRKLQNYLKTYEKIDEIVVLTDAEVTPENLYYFLVTYFPRRLKDFPKSRFLFAYSGHGTTQNDKGYLLTSDAVSLNDTFHAIPMTTVRANFQQVIDAGHHVLALINACYSGEFIKRSFGGDQHFIPRYPGAHAITAGGTRELTWHDGSVGTGSVFFEKFFAALDGRAGRDGIVTIDDLAAYLRREVQITTEQNQNPLPGDLSRDGSLGGFFFFNRLPLVEAKVLPGWDTRRGVPFGEPLPDENVLKNNLPPQVDENERLRVRYAALMTQGDTDLNNRNFDSAIVNYSEAILLDPKDAIAFNNRGLAYRDKREFDRAIADCNEAIRLDPTYAKAVFGRGTAYRRRGDPDRAIIDYNEAIRLDPTYANIFNGRGNAYANKGDYDRAIADYNEAIRLDPKDARVFNGRGFSYMNKGDNDRAIADHSEAIRLDPSLAGSFVNRGNAYRNKRDYDRAIADYNEAIRLDPKYVTAFNGRGIAYGNKGDNGQAIADFIEAIRLDPKYSAAFSNRGVAYSRKGQDDLAIRDYNEAIRLDPKNALAFCNLGRIKLRKGDKRGGSADMERAKQLDSSSCQ
jgi:tetratricopeptide (TPR) repeat protein